MRDWAFKFVAQGTRLPAPASAPAPEADYALFRWPTEERPAPPVPLAGFQTSYGSLRHLLRTPKLLWYWSLWHLYSLLLGRLQRPQLFLIFQRGRIIHYSFILPKLGRIEGMTAGDIEVGPCFTDPRCRGVGCFSHALRRICHDFWAPNRTIWMLSREANATSKAVIGKSGFARFASCIRRKRPFFPGHQYFLRDFRETDPGRAESRQTVHSAG